MVTIWITFGENITFWTQFPNKILKKKKMDNYTLPTCGLPLILCAYLWFKFWHFTHLWFSPWVCRNPPLHFPLLKHRISKKQTPKQIKTLSSILEHEEHTQKNLKNIICLALYLFLFVSSVGSLEQAQALFFSLYLYMVTLLH